ncbi:MAG: cyclic-di-AMP receptor [Anaerolineae bacterium]|nr:cyclic-di-AMP receptor [Anaerolineae bacterium]
MKIILAIVRDDVVDAISDALIAGDYHVTRVSSTGGFLRRGNTTLVCGVEDDQVEGAMAVIRSTCCDQRPESQVHCATIFVLDAENAVQI